MEDFEILEKGPDYFVAEAEGEKYMVEDMGEKNESAYTLRVGDSDTVYVDETFSEQNVQSTSELVHIPKDADLGDSYEQVAQNVMEKYFGNNPFELEEREDSQQEALEESDLEPEGEGPKAENGFGLDQYH